MSESRQTPKLAALILAAGFSSRMGSFKPLLPLDGMSAIAWSVRAFRAAGIARIFAVTGYQADALDPLLHDLGVFAVRNRHPEHGMYSSLQLGMAALEPSVEACFVLPADTPLIGPAALAALAASYAASPRAVLYPTCEGLRGHPPLVDRCLFGEILAGHGEGGLRSLLAKYDGDAGEIDVLDPCILFDMDTPDDYVRLAEVAVQRQTPTAADCEAILAAHRVAEPIRRHGRAVAAVARALARHLPWVDKGQVEAAALLHDIAKGQPHHAEAGAQVLAELGYPALAEVVCRHMDLDFRDGTPDASAVVFLADKLVREDRRVSLESRFAPAFSRFTGQPEALQGATRRYESAKAVLAAIERQSGMAIPELLADCGVPA